MPAQVYNSVSAYEYICLYRLSNPRRGAPEGMTQYSMRDQVTTPLGKFPDHVK